MQTTVYPSLVDEIKARLPILEAIQTLIPVERLTVRGNRATGLCPLHTERTPSFTVYLDSNSWYCFGCHQGGDVIDLYAAYNHLSNGEAIWQLADYLGLARSLSVDERKRARAEKIAKRREIEKALDAAIEARIKEVFDQLAALERNGERRLLEFAGTGKDPLEDDNCCRWLRMREWVSRWLDVFVAGDVPEKIQALKEVEECRDILRP